MSAVYLVEPMHGLGDTLFIRMVLKNFPHEFYIKTPWPQLFSDLPQAHCMHPDNLVLRTQKKNVDKHPYAWAELPTDKQVLRMPIGYHFEEVADRGMTILQSLARFTRTSPAMGLPALPPCPVDSGGRPIGIIRPATVRAEWAAVGRNPLPEYLYQAAEEMQRQGYYVVSVADLDDRAEWLVGDAPPADLTLHRGELKVLDLLSLVQHSAVVVGGVGFIQAAALSAGTPMYLVCGGNLACNAPRVVLNGEPPADWGIAVPDDPCYCDVMTHDCNKVISGFETKFRAWLAALCSR